MEGAHVLERTEIHRHHPDADASVEHIRVSQDRRLRPGHELFSS